MRRSAGLMMYRWRAGVLEVFLVHPGGPYWAKKDAESWTVPKGEYEESEEALDAARREFQEETGFLSQGPFWPLGSIVQAGGKVVIAWAFEGDCAAETLVSNTCEIEWPPRSGKRLEIPEVDRGAWCGLEEAGRRIRPSQAEFLEALKRALNVSGNEPKPGDSGGKG